MHKTKNPKAEEVERLMVDVARGHGTSGEASVDFKSVAQSTIHVWLAMLEEWVALALPKFADTKLPMERGTT